MGRCACRGSRISAYDYVLVARKYVGMPRVFVSLSLSPTRARILHTRVLRITMQAGGRRQPFRAPVRDLVTDTHATANHSQRRYAQSFSVQAAYLYSAVCSRVNRAC